MPAAARFDLITIQMIKKISQFGFFFYLSKPDGNGALKALVCERKAASWIGFSVRNTAV